MLKLLLLSVLGSVVAIPALAAKDPNPTRGLRRAIRNVLLFNVFYLFVLRFLYGRI